MNKTQFYTLSGALLASTALAASVAPTVPRQHRFREGEPAFDLQKVLADPKSKQILEEWAEREVAAGLKTKNGEIFGKLTAYRIGGTDDKPEYLDPAKAKNAMAALAKIDPNGKGNVEELIQEAVTQALTTKDRELEAVSRDRDAHKASVDKERAARHRLLMNHELNTALATSGVKPNKAKLHAKFLADNLTVDVDKDGNERVIVVDADRKPRYGSQGLMKVADYIKEYSTDKDNAEDWQADNKGGSGAGPQHVRGPGGKAITIDPNASPTERLNQYRSAQG